MRVSIMVEQRIVVLIGSASDLPFAHRIEDFLKKEHFQVKLEYKISSAHRNPEKLISDLSAYEKSRDEIVYITMAGLSDALSGIVAGYVMNPVIACPPDLNVYEWGKVFSSAFMPKGVPVMLVPEPENAALAAVKVLAVANHELKNALEKYRGRMREVVTKADAEMRRKEAYELEREHVERIDHLEHGEHPENE